MNHKLPLILFLNTLLQHVWILAPASNGGHLHTANGFLPTQLLQSWTTRRWRREYDYRKVRISKKCCDSDNGNISLWKRSCLTTTKWMNGCLRIWPLCFVRSVLTDRLQLANSWKLEPLPVHVVSGLVSILIIWTLPCLSYCASIFTEAFLRFALEVWDGLTCWVGTGITLLP